MYRLTLGLLTFAFIFSFNITWSQVKTDSLVKNPVTTKSIDKTKVTTTKTIDKTKVGVTKTTTTKETEVTTSTNKKKIDVTKPIDEKKIDVTKPSNIKKIDTLNKAKVTKGTGTAINTKCIVSGEDIDSKITADYKGVTYAFCCKTCLKKFTADPEKYVSKLDKETSKTIN